MNGDTYRLQFLWRILLSSELCLELKLVCALPFVSKDTSLDKLDYVIHRMGLLYGVMDHILTFLLHGHKSLFFPLE